MSDVKMSECFSLPITTKASRDCCDEWETLAYDSVGDFMFQLPDDVCIDSVVTAINSYDSNQELIAKLQADNELLRKQLVNMVGWGADFMNVDDLDDEEDRASAQSNFNDAIISADKALEATKE